MANVIFVRFYYALSVVIPILLFAFRLEKKDKFILKFSIGVFALVAFNVIVSFFIFNVEKYPFFGTFYFDIIFFVIELLIAISMCYSCFKQNMMSAIYCGTAGYCIQHIWGKVIDYFLYLIFKDISKWLYYGLAIVLFIGLCVLIEKFVIIKMIPKGGSYAKASTKQVIISIVVVGISIIYNALAFSFIKQATQLITNAEAAKTFQICSNIFLNILEAVVAILCLFILFDLYESKEITTENATLNKMLENQKKQYELEKENVKLINIKCHDLKHQLLALNGKMSKEQIDESIKTINIYDSFVHTGNEAIDIILSQKNLYCKAHDIRLSCNIDGKLLDFIPTHEIYSIFGNALENAIEGVENLPIEKRVIHINQDLNGNLLNIHFENYFDGNLILKEGMPASKKGDKDYHGFGVVSMRMLVEKYEGKLNISTKQDVFCLDLFFVLPVAKKK